MLAQDEQTRAQLDRILHSETFRNSEALRRLLRFLAEKSIAGEADSLKEYSIAVDALGKPSTYDPRQDSVVRIQVGRLRQKLAEYYRSEGKNDATVMDLPKGHFRLSVEPRPASSNTPEPDLKLVAPSEFPWRKLALIFGATTLVATIWSIYAGLELAKQRKVAKAALSPALEQLWSPFLNSHRPLVLSVAAPLFVGLPGAGLFRDLSLNHWSAVQQSQKVAAVQRALGATSIVPRYYYTGVGETNAVFQLGRLFTNIDLHISLAKSSELSWQQLSDSNVIMVGAARLFTDPLRSLPLELDFVMDERGINNLKPQPGELTLYPDNYPSLLISSPSGVPDDGEIYALVSHRPGPLGSGDVESFNSNHSPGTLGAVRLFTEPTSAEILLSKLRNSLGQLPRYYQVVLKVRYKDAVPTEVSYVTHHEIQSPTAVASTK